LVPPESELPPPVQDDEFHEILPGSKRRRDELPDLPEDMMPSKIVKVSDQELLDALNRAYFYCHLHAKAKYYRGVQITDFENYNPFAMI
jgi:hypothetical protein